MNSLSNEERLSRVVEKLGGSIPISKAAEVFDIPYGTLFSLGTKQKVIDLEKISGKNYVDINSRFHLWVRTYRPMSTEGRRRLSKGMKKVYKRKKGNGIPKDPAPFKIPLTHDEREPGYIEPIKLTDVQSLSLSGKIAAINEILRAVADEVNDLQELKEKIRAII